MHSGSGGMMTVVGCWGKLSAILSMLSFVAVRLRRIAWLCAGRDGQSGLNTPGGLLKDSVCTISSRLLLVCGFQTSVECLSV